MAPVRLGRDDYAVLREAGDRHAWHMAHVDRSVGRAVIVELDLDLASLASDVLHGLADEGVQTHKHLVETGTRRDAPGRDATRGR